jgi:FAD/FMN-containing dehydrogenase
MPEPLIETTVNATWHNWHRTDGVGGPVQKLFKPRNRWISDRTDPRRWFAPGLAGLQEIVQRAEADGRRVRAVGAGWSLSPVAFVDDYLVDTSALSEWSLGFSARIVTSAFADRRERMAFVQCGVQIRTLNSFLERRRLALPTSGASNGQTIVGAMSTGTHGSAHDVGSIADTVLGLHVVGEGGRHYWIEPRSRPAMTRAFVDWLGAEPRRDDDLFHSAVVGFGSFGLIHAVVFAAEPVYVLDRFVRRIDFDDVVPAACGRAVDGLGLPKGAELPFHFEVVVNPYLRGRGQRGAFLRVYYKRPLAPGEPLPVLSVDGAGKIRSPDLVKVASFVSDAVPNLVPGLLQGQLEQAIRPTGDAMPAGLPGQVFDDTLPSNGGTSTELGVPLARVGDALDAILSVTDRWTFGAPVALRYVRASDALLAFTCHGPTTCTIELPGIDSGRAREGHRRIWSTLASRGVPHTYHWGQALPALNRDVLSGFDEERVDRWRTARAGFLTAGGRRTFSNSMIDDCGLA